ncbi:MAG TPA: dihydrofolate reductase family protein [Solirubrobacteraceae bacterium]|jgi:riboflavin biosynthesis pyrimidine reductase|nr:dihydrofolate reductase family protein [Solirubrobacteraceae bacterium]
MEFQPAIPPGPPAPPEAFYTGLDLATHAPAQRPYVIANFISSVDGKAAADGRTAPLGSPGDRAAFHLLRTEVDAVLAGTRTMFIENYGPLAKEPRLSELRVRAGRGPQPLGVVISRSGTIPFEIPLFADADSRVAVYGPPGLQVPDTAAEVIVHELTRDEGALGGVLRSLRADHGVSSLLCEGGPSLFSALLLDGLVDELFLTLAPKLVGGDAVAITTGAPLDELRDVRLVCALEQDGTLFLRYARRP